MATTTLTDDLLPASGLGPKIDARRLFHPWRWLTSIIALLFIVELVRSMVMNDRFEWSLVGHYLFDSRIVHGVKITIILTVFSMVIAVVLGTILAIMRRARNPILSIISVSYIWFFRGTPLLVQMLFWAYASAVYPIVGINIPFGPQIIGVPYNELIPLFVAGLLALSLNEAAYAAEIVRAGMISVDKGQVEAGRALGMTELMITLKIILPQAIRVIVPPLGNATISMLKMTSLAFVIAVPELLTSAKIIYGANFQQIPLLTVACVWYLFLTTLLNIAQSKLEQKVGKGFSTYEWR